MSVREMLWPTRWKVAASFFIAAVSVFLIYLVNPYYQTALFGLDFYLRVVSVFASLLIVTAIYYPLTCGLIFLLREFWGKPTKERRRPKERRRQESPSVQKRRDMIIAVLLIIVFNPLTFSLVAAVSAYVNNNVINHPCGVMILGFSDNSSAEMAGMQTGEVIIQVDNQAIDTTDSLAHVLAGKSPANIVAVTTDISKYDIRLGENPDTHRAVLGIITQNAYCRR
jgi:membrane-associated protease RseP (regulator of RpoE activity)